MGYSFISSIYFGTLGVHGLIYIAWACGGVKAQKTYILLFWLGLLHMFSSMIIATGFGWDSGNILYNLSFCRLFLEVLVTPLIFAVLNDMVTFMSVKHNLPNSLKYLSFSSIAQVVIVTCFALLVYFQLNTAAEQDKLVLIRMGSIVLYVNSQPLLILYFWEVFWLCVALFYSTLLRVWLPCFWLHISLIGYLVIIVFSPVFSFEFSIYSVAYFKTSVIYCLLVLQQKIARRDINDRGYEVHQNQFNLIYRRVLHISS
ncbi:hypothetical protein SteCoe_7766 [Stentor coeruleus]|uniref:Uncharacterized protein n=1 Tax=Stentor coeruleus TaxID=5963 RepID=A0A1R2CLT3_9CILI|nr:hypothetical protein SteCoe_7766 [Stentor coeruleus]